MSTKPRWETPTIEEQHQWHINHLIDQSMRCARAYLDELAVRPRSQWESVNDA